MKNTSLFSSRPVRSRMTIMVAGSVLVHTCLVQLGASMWQPSLVEGERVYPIVDVFDPPPPWPSDQQILVSNPVPTPLSEVTTTPPLVEPPVTVVTPPSVEDQEMTEPTPLPRPHVAPARVSHQTVATTVAHGAATIPGASNGGPQAGGGLTGRVGSGATLGWKTPKPPYPRMALMARAQGATTVHFTTDALGHVASVEIVRSTGNAALDAATLSYVRNNWTGPANAVRMTEFVYQLP